MKQKLRDLLAAGRSREEADLLPFVDDSPPLQAGRWTAKDQLAHLSAWRDYAAAEVRAVVSGGPRPEAAHETQVQNERIYAATHDRPVAAVRADAARSWDALFAAVEACSEEDLVRPRLRNPAQQLWQSVRANSSFHVGEQLAYWLSERGDGAGADAAARWGHDLTVEVFADDRSRGVAAYNLGCYYAGGGRAVEAARCFRTAFELRPDLIDFARSDSDLDAIRQSAELKELLG